MKHIITPTATSNAEKKQYLNANGSRARKYRMGRASS